jgi:hypothetical protein
VLGGSVTFGGGGRGCWSFSLFGFRAAVALFVTAVLNSEAGGFRAFASLGDRASISMPLATIVFVFHGPQLNLSEMMDLGDDDIV